MSSSPQVKWEIIVQPPTRVGLSQPLYPPIVARSCDPWLLHDYHTNAKQFFAVLSLWSVSDMKEYTAHLNGTLSVSPELITDPSGDSSKSSRGSSSGGSSSRAPKEVVWLYFNFNSFRVGIMGSFYFNVSLYALSFAAREAETIWVQSTRQVTIVAGPVSPERPSMSYFIYSNGVNHVKNLPRTTRERSTAPIGGRKSDELACACLGYQRPVLTERQSCLLQG